MKNIFTLLSSLLIFPALAQKPVSVWLTDPSASLLFQKQKNLSFGTNDTKEISSQHMISVDETKRYQNIDGFGFALTGGSAMNLMQMSKPSRKGLLQKLFATDENHIGTSYLRVSVGASDLNAFVFSYDDLPPGETDTALLHFNLGQDTKDVIPVLKEILAINPAIKIMASPWSPPVWMKDNNDTRGGSLLKKYYGVYAAYLVKYIQEMKKQGIRIDAMTVQNEPLHPGNNPSLFMPAADQADFVKNHLGPAFHQHKISTKIIVYDHNADKPEYPISILNDPEAKKYIDGSAFHLYAGPIDALSKVHEAHPDKNVYFTEQWIGAPGSFEGDIPWHIRELIIGATRNWAKTVLEWNLASDAEYKPYTDRGGCTSCLGAVTIQKDSFVQNPAYYIIAHAAKWVRPGSVRIETAADKSFPNVAFTTPAGKTVLIILNNSGANGTVLIAYKKQSTSLSLTKGAVATLVW